MRGNNIKEKNSNRLSNKQNQLNLRKEGVAAAAAEDGNAASVHMVHNRESCLPVAFFFLEKEETSLKTKPYLHSSHIFLFKLKSIKTPFVQTIKEQMGICRKGKDDEKISVSYYGSHIASRRLRSK
jgi:hypothetical protein